MIVMNLNIRNEAYEKIMYFLESLPKQDIQIVTKRLIEEVDPVTLDKDDFDYISRDELDKMTKSIEEAKKNGLSNLKNFDEL